jgi:hypothetical protein
MRRFIHFRRLPVAPASSVPFSCSGCQGLPYTSPVPEKDFLYFLFCWHLAGLILHGNGDFGFEEALSLFFLFRSGHTTIVAKLISPVKFCTVDFFTGFAP